MYIDELRIGPPDSARLDSDSKKLDYMECEELIRFCLRLEEKFNLKITLHAPHLKDELRRRAGYEAWIEGNRQLKHPDRD